MNRSKRKSQPARNRGRHRLSLTGMLLILLIPVFLAACEGSSRVCQVEKVEWIGVPRNDGATNLEVGDNPEDMGGGDRIFPGRNRRAGGDLHDQVKVRVTLSKPPPVAQMVVVHFKLFDEDHYSDNPNFDPNGVSESDDNVKAGEPLTIDVGAKLMTADFSSEATRVLVHHDPLGESPPEIAEMGLQLTDLQPGNNWTVAAHCPNELVKGVEGDLIVPPAPENWEDKKRTPLLTVWRRLYAELDRMGDPILNSGLGQSKFDGGKAQKFAGLGGETGKVVQLELPAGQTILQDDQFLPGRITLLDKDGNQLLRTAVVGSRTGNKPLIETFDAVPDATAMFADLMDDDILNGSSFRITRSDHMEIDFSLWESRLRPALVVPVFDQPGAATHNSIVPFALHIGTDPLADPDVSQANELQDTIRTNKGSRSEPGFWVAYQLGAFQGHLSTSADPRIGEAIYGVTNTIAATSDSEAGSAVFAETIRDQAENDNATTVRVSDLRRLTSIHELGHQFGMDDTGLHGPLMVVDRISTANSSAEVDRLAFNGRGLRKIMTTKQPGHDPQ